MRKQYDTQSPVHSAPIISQNFQKRKEKNYVMNSVFYLIVVAAAVLLWFLSAFVFRPLGSMLLRLIRNALKKMDEEEENEKDE